MSYDRPMTSMLIQADTYEGPGLFEALCFAREFERSLGLLVCALFKVLLGLTPTV